MTLFEAVCDFEKLLPEGFCFSLFANTKHINTWKDESFGNLHRVYWDETDTIKEDPLLIELLEPFVKETKLALKEGNEQVMALKEYIHYEKIRLDKEKKKKKVRSIDEDWDF